MSKSRNILIGGLLLAIVFMAVGYAALAQQLNVNGTASIDASWDIKFTNIKEKNMLGATTVGIPSASGTSATFEVELAYPGASATYDITVENGGSIDAVLESISGVDTANEAVPEEIQYEVTGIATGDDLTASQTKTFQIIVKWIDSDSIPTATSKTATITLNYKQKA